MNYSNNYNFALPTVGAGDEANIDFITENFVQLDYALKDVSDRAVPAKMEFIRSVTLSEDVKSVKINVDTDGDAFSCSKIFLVIQFPTAISIGATGSANTLYIQETTGATKYLYYASTTHNTLILRLTAEALGSESTTPLGITQIAFSQYDWSEDAINYGRTQNNLTVYSSIVIGSENSVIPSGTIIKLYGVK